MAVTYENFENTSSKGFFDGVYPVKAIEINHINKLIA